MDDTKAPSRHPLHDEIVTLEAQLNSGHGDRHWIHRRMHELRNAMNHEANPVLRTEYLRRLSLLDGSAGRR